MTSPKSNSIIKKTPKKSSSASGVKGRPTRKSPLGTITASSANKPMTRSESKLGSLSTLSSKARDDEDIENQSPAPVRGDQRSQRKQNADGPKESDAKETSDSNDSQPSSEIPSKYDGAVDDAKSVTHGNESVDQNFSEVARRRGGRGRGRKAFATRSTAGVNRSVVDNEDKVTRHSKSTTIENVDDYSDKSIVTTAGDEGNNSALSATMQRHSHKTSGSNIPKASSPVAPSKQVCVGGSNKSARQQSMSGDTSISRSTSGGNKSHRGVVAEMYAHERRHAHNSRSKSLESQSTAPAAIHAQPHQIMNRIYDPSLRATAQIPVGSTYFPFGLPSLPAAGGHEASLSPYGISPFAEPNSSWTTNVYVNNLPPHTTDEDLLRLGSCFGRVKSHKAIINQETSLCKGYGFIMYEILHDAELAIQQLPLHGLSTSWAKESFSSKLRRMADSTTSNVYLSNLPQDITPAQLESLFQPHAVISLRILTDTATGQSRGVGFVRLRDRHASQECIERLNGMTFDGQESPLQVRFADSEAQKQFKMCARMQLSKDAPDSAKGAEEDSSANSTRAATGPASSAANVKGATPSAFIAALQPNHSWTGFATPASTSGGFSPMLGVMSPQMAAGYQALSPQMGGAVPMYPHHEAYLAQFDAPTVFSGRMANGFVDPYAESHRLDWLANQRLGGFVNPAQGEMYGMVQHPHTYPHHHTAPLAHHAPPMPPQHAHQDGQQSRRPQSHMVPPSSSASHAQQPLHSKTRATYLPPDLALQHARALMEKGAQGASQAHAFALTQQHVEKERIGLLKLLKEANDNLVRLRADATSESTGASGNNSIANDSVDKGANSTLTPSSSTGSIIGAQTSALGLLGLMSSTATAVEPTTTSGTLVARRFSNPNGAGTSKKHKGDNPAEVGVSNMRQSVSAASLSPLRFLYSKDPHAPISVEAVDVTRPHSHGESEEGELEEGEIKETKVENAKTENEGGAQAALPRADTPAPAAVAAKGSLTDAPDAPLFDQPSMVLEDDKENTVADESNECSYASLGGTTSSNNDESNTSSGSEVMQQKTPPEGGKMFEVTLPSSHPAASGLTSIMVLHNAGTEKRARSKSVVIHAPFDVGIDGNGNPILGEQRNHLYHIRPAGEGNDE